MTLQQAAQNKNFKHCQERPSQLDFISFLFACFEKQQQQNTQLQ